MFLLVWHTTLSCILLVGAETLGDSRDIGESFSHDISLKDTLGDTEPKDAWEDATTRLGDEYLQMTIDRIPVEQCPRERRTCDNGNNINNRSNGSKRNKRSNNKIRETNNKNNINTGSSTDNNRSKRSYNNRDRNDKSSNEHGSQMRVLLLHPIYAGSHEMTLRALGEELAARGHLVTQLRLSSNIALPVGKSFWCVGEEEGVRGGEERVKGGGLGDGEKSARGSDTAREGGMNTRGQEESARREDKAPRGSEDQGIMEVITISPNNTSGRYPHMSSNGTVYVPTESLWSTAVDIFKIPWMIHRIIEAHCSSLLASPALLAALRARRFTVAVVDLLGNDCGLALARLLGIPVLGSWEIPLQAPSVRNYGVYLPLGTVPRVMTGLGHEMTLWDRLYNVLHSASAEVILVAYYWIVDYWIQSHQPSLPGVLTLLKEVDAIVINTHRDLDYPLHLPPHLTYIGCVMCRVGRPLPFALHNWVSNTTASGSGTVIMSFGFTGFDPEVIPSDFMTEVVTGLGQLPYQVILQFDASKLAIVPDNVRVQRWMPQQDLLAHPSTVLLISHCGMKAVTEAVYHGVPLLCVPVFADQGDVARRVQDRGLGLTLDRRGLTGGQLVRAVEAVTLDDRFAMAAQKLSKMWRAEPETAMDTMIRWLVTVHHFAPLTHLRPVQEHRLHLLQYTGIDAMFCLLLISVLTASMAFFPSLWKQAWQRVKVLVLERSFLFGSVGKGSDVADLNGKEQSANKSKGKVR